MQDISDALLLDDSPAAVDSLTLAAAARQHAVVHLPNPSAVAAALAAANNRDVVRHVVAAAKYHPGEGKCTVRQPSFYDRETLLDKLSQLEVEGRELRREERELQCRHDDSKDKVARLLEKKRVLANRRELKDFKVEVRNPNCEDKSGTREDKISDGWLAAPPPPPQGDDDPLSLQLRTLSLKLLNGELLKSLPSLLSLADRLEEDADDVERSLAEKRSLLSSLPAKAMQSAPDVQLDVLRLSESLLSLEVSRDSDRRRLSSAVAASRSGVSPRAAAVTVLREDLRLVREDVQYWCRRLRAERASAGPALQRGEALKQQLGERARQEGMEGWQGAVLKAAFIVGCNLDDFDPETIRKEGGRVRHYVDVVDKIRVRRMPEVVRNHLFPKIANVRLEEVRALCEKNDIWYDRESVGDTKLGFDEFYIIVKGLREMKEEEQARGIGGGDEAYTGEDYEADRRK